MVKKRLSTRKHFRKHKKVHRTRKRNLHRRVKKTQRKIKRRTRRRRQRGGEASQASRRAQQPKLVPTNSYNVDSVNTESRDQNFAKFCVGAPWKLTGAIDEDPLLPTLEKAIEDANKDCKNDPPDPTKLLSEHFHRELEGRPPLHSHHLKPDEWKGPLPWDYHEHIWLEQDPNRGGRLVSLAPPPAPPPGILAGRPANHQGWGWRQGVENI